MMLERGDGTIVGALPLHRSLLCLVGLLGASLLLARDVLAQGLAVHDEPSREELPTARIPTPKHEEGLNHFRQSTFTFDQSISTQTADVGLAPQSYVPLYEIWLSFRPRYHFDEHWSVRGRFDYTKELTNSESTTYYREDVFGDIWTDLVYGTKLDQLWRGTTVQLGARALWPTSKASQGNGTYVTLGLTGGASHTFDIKGPAASTLNSAHVSLTFAYLHPFTDATTPTDYGAFAYTRQNVDGFSFISDQLTGQTLPEHVLWAILDTGLQVTPRLSLTGDVVIINEWHYGPTGTVHVPISGGSVAVPPPIGDNQYIEDTWLLANVSYLLFDELSLSVGYYNLANSIAPDGQTRGLWGPDNIWWSPSARLFFDITANLDVLFDDARGRHQFTTKQASAAPRPEF
jgi:hypothetical protein